MHRLVDVSLCPGGSAFAGANSMDLVSAIPPRVASVRADGLSRQRILYSAPLFAVWPLPWHPVALVFARRYPQGQQRRVACHYPVCSPLGPRCQGLGRRSGCSRSRDGAKRRSDGGRAGRRMGPASAGRKLCVVMAQQTPPTSLLLVSTPETFY